MSDDQTYTSKSKLADKAWVKCVLTIVILILLAAIMYPNFIRARKRTAAERTEEELREIDKAIAQYEIKFKESLRSNEEILKPLPLRLKSK